jgi:AcrR family transcriptional regulator
MGHIERRQKEKENIRKSIMEAALDLAISDGWNAVTIRKIANAIEYTPPIVYEHFKNKDDLLNELVTEGHRKLYKGNELAIKNNTKPQTKLIAISLNMWDFAFKNKELYQLMFNLERPILNDEIHVFTRKIINLFNDILGNEEIAQEIMFNWVCLQQGYIYCIKQMGPPPDLKNENPRALYLKAMERFISKL